MTANDRLETTIGAWLDEGPMDLPDMTRRAILTAIPTTQQARRGRFAPGRFVPMPTFYRAAAVITILVIVIGGGALLLGPRDTGPGGQEATPSPTSTPTVTPTPSVEPAVDRGTPSPLEGRTPTFVKPFSYRLPAGQDLQVDDSDPTWYQFRHPNPVAQGYDKGIVVRTIGGGRVDPCDETSAAKPMADPQAFLDYFRSVPTMELSDEGTFTVDGYPGIAVTAAWGEPTAECANVWLWPVEESITDLGGRTTARLSIADVDGTYVLFNTFPAEFSPYADQFISSIRFDRLSSSASPEP
jgi:hypothetical protein